MKVIIIGGGIAAVYLANGIKKQNSSIKVTILSKESYMPYDRVHLCRLVDKSSSIKDITLPLNVDVEVRLNQEITKIVPENKKVFSQNGEFSYDKLIIATGSKPITLFDIKNIHNATVFRSINDCKKIQQGMKNKNVVIIGSGPIGLELLETLNNIKELKSITLLVRSDYLYSKDLSNGSIKILEEYYKKNDKLTISYNDEIVDKEIKDFEIVLLKTKKLTIENPFLIFGVGIRPNIEHFRDTLLCDRGILTNAFMQTNQKDIYAVGECAQVKELNFIAGHVKDCTNQADVVISQIFAKQPKEFRVETNIDMLKVGGYELVDVNNFINYQKEYEKITISSKKNSRVDEYFVNDDKLIRFIGINSNVDVGYIKSLIDKEEKIDINYLYENREVGERGRLICSCEHVYYQDLLDLITQNQIHSFSELAQFSNAGRVCGRCRINVQEIIKNSQSLIKDAKKKKIAKKDPRLIEAKKRIEKYNQLHPYNLVSTQNLEAALESVEIAKKELNSWISMLTANMQLHPIFEDVIKDGVKALNKIPIIWLELADCSGNSEAFIKSSNPSIEDLIFDYISLDYHELIMSSSGDDSESVLEKIIKEEKEKYVLIVEGAVPLGINGKFLRIGKYGTTGIELLKKCAKNAGMILAVGSCAFDGGVVAAKPNPTNAVGVSQALNQKNVINLPGCPVNPVNIVGTLLYYLMFEELPELDKFNRPLWAYEGRVHDNCERRGHYELKEFVLEWGDEGAKKGYCLFKMGCKGPYANVNCPTMKFNNATSWPVQAGHGCMACVEMGFFDKYANEREYNAK